MGLGSTFWGRFELGLADKVEVRVQGRVRVQVGLRLGLVVLFLDAHLSYHVPDLRGSTHVRVRVRVRARVRVNWIYGSMRELGLGLCRAHLVFMYSLHTEHVQIRLDKSWG